MYALSVAPFIVQDVFVYILYLQSVLWCMNQKQSEQHEFLSQGWLTLMKYTAGLEKKPK